jgi:hypothetical protein
MRHQAKIAGLARAKHQSVCSEAHRPMEAIDCLVMDFKRGHRQLEQVGVGSVGTWRDPRTSRLEIGRTAEIDDGADQDSFPGRTNSAGAFAC